MEGTSYVGNWELGVVPGYEPIIEGVVVGDQALSLFVREDCG